MNLEDNLRARFEVGDLILRSYAKSGKASKVPLYLIIYKMGIGGASCIYHGRKLRQQRKSRSSPTTIATFCQRYMRNLVGITA